MTGEETRRLDESTYRYPTVEAKHTLCGSRMFIANDRAGPSDSSAGWDSASEAAAGAAVLAESGSARDSNRSAPVHVQLTAHVSCAGSHPGDRRTGMPEGMRALNEFN